VNLDADEVENVDWICDSCKSGKQQNSGQNGLGNHRCVIFLVSGWCHGRLDDGWLGMYCAKREGQGIPHSSLSPLVAVLV
jgi:hypothetical protein